MPFKGFTLALLFSFGVPWLMLIVVPFAKMRNLETVSFTEADDGKDELYLPKRSGRIRDGARVYASNGCYVCHSQLIRYSFAGSEFGREGWAGFKEEDAEGLPIDTRRETTPYDYQGESFAHIGLTRNGPDLSNVGKRITKYLKVGDSESISPEQWVYQHLYNSRTKSQNSTYWSTCPSQRHLFVTQDKSGQGSLNAIKGLGEDDEEVLPTDDVIALASYLLSLSKDDAVPYSMNYSRDKKKAE